MAKLVLFDYELGLYSSRILKILILNIKISSIVRFLHRKPMYHILTNTVLSWGFPDLYNLVTLGSSRVYNQNNQNVKCWFYKWIIYWSEIYIHLRFFITCRDNTVLWLMRLHNFTQTHNRTSTIARTRLTCLILDNEIESYPANTNVCKWHVITIQTWYRNAGIQTFIHGILRNVLPWRTRGVY